MKNKKTVVLGMSGGVDSSVSASILKNNGYNVIGLYMNNWEETDENGVCTAVSDYEDVKRVCAKIGIPFYSVNFAKEYLDKVFSFFLKEYENGRTPNPDVLCNREIKFGSFSDFAKTLNADYIATGHYCKVEKTPDGIIHLLKAKDLNKDQSYFLNQLSQSQLKNVIFPLSDIDKFEVRKIAKELDLVNALKKDSTGICFIGEKRFREFLKNYLPANSGDIKDLQGNIVGKHEGVMFYTLGQRRGLNLGGIENGNGKRWFVIEKDVKNNILYVSQGENNKLFSKGLIANSVNWICGEPKINEFECYAKFRYRQPDQKVKVIINKSNVEVKFDAPQRAVTPGQYVVFYNQFGNSDMECLGGGIIDDIIF